MSTLRMSDITDIVSEFLEVAIHQILYVRGLYPKEIFTARQKYNVPVQMSRHPDVNLYINHIAAACKDGIQKGIVKSVAVAMVDAKQNPVERFVFELNSLFQLSPHQHMDSVTTELRLLDLEQELRAFLLRINAAGAMLRPLPKGCQFSLVVDMTKSIAPTSTQEMKTGVSPWIPADAFQKEEAFHGSSLMPLKSFDTGVLQINFFVQETEN